MALVGFEGFDNYATAATDLLNRAGGALQWAAESASFVSPGRTGSGTYLSMAQNGAANLVLASAIATGYLGFASQILTPGGTQPSVAFVDTLSSSLAQVTIQWDFTRNGFNVIVNGATVAHTANNVIVFSAWNYLEFSVTIASSATGQVIIRNNGQTILSVGSLVTRASGSTHSSFDGVNFTGPRAPSTCTFNIDDLYLADSTVGPGLFAFNTFAGDVRAIALNPIGAGASTQWTPLTSTNWFEVSEVHNTGDTSYNSTNTVNNTDLFNFAQLANTISSVLAVQLIGSYRKDDAAVRQIAQQMVSAGTTVDGATWNVAASYTYFADVFVLDPHTAANWTVSGVNAVQAGYVLIT